MTRWLLALCVLAPVLAARRSTADASRWPTRVLLAAAVVVAATSPFLAPDSLLESGAGLELRSVRTLIPNPESTLVVAPHGLEWFAGFFLYTPVRLGGYGSISAERPPEGAFARYFELHEFTRPRS